MARPRKSDAEKAKPQEIHVPDATWAAIREEAAAAGLSTSQYLIRIRASRRSVTDTSHIVRACEHLHGIDQSLHRIADGLARRDGMSSIGALLRLAAIERQIQRFQEKVLVP